MKKPTTSTNPRPGTRVGFLTNNLGASKQDELYGVTGEIYGVGDSGKVAFNHPNKKACPDWFYVEVESKEEPGEKRYVGVTARMVGYKTCNGCGRFMSNAEIEVYESRCEVCR